MEGLQAYPGIKRVAYLSMEGEDRHDVSIGEEIAPGGRAEPPVVGGAGGRSPGTGGGRDSLLGTGGHALDGHEGPSEGI